MPFLKIPTSISTSTEAHGKWLAIVRQAEELIQEDFIMQKKRPSRANAINERSLPPEMLGRSYASYCTLINKMYDAYLNSVHMQRSPYMLEIISVFMKRLYELRNELVHLIVNDYIYVDAALTQLHLTPYDIQIVFPYHIPLESRPDSVEQLLQKMWSDAIKRKNAPPVKEVVRKDNDDDFLEELNQEPATEQITPEESVHTIIPQDFIQACVIQRQERFRKFYIEDYRSNCIKRRIYFAAKVIETPLELKKLAATLIQRIYRAYMKIKRDRVRDLKRDVLLGLLPDPCRKNIDFDEENTKIYERRRKTKLKIQETYLRAWERENMRLICFKKEDQIDDITEQVREWFKEWYYGYGFFPEFPYDVEGGTLMVIKGTYPTIEEKVAEDEKYLASIKGKTKEQLQQEKEQAEADALMKAELAQEAKEKEAELLFRLRCNPFADPGYQPKKSEVTSQIADALRKYRLAWSIYDRFPPKECADTIYGYMQPLITEDIMCELHQDCRRYVDELMRLDLKLLIKAHQLMYKSVGWKYPKIKPRKKPKTPPLPKLLNVDSNVLKSLEEIFDLGIISKPTSKIKDIYGDFNYAAYDLNIRDPDAKFPPPAYGDVRQRLLLSCALGSGVEPAARRNKAVLVTGPPRNGKSFLVDCVAGEINGIKIDISPEGFSAVVKRPAKMLSLVFLAARVFQPAVIYYRNVERVFAKKVLPQDKWLRAKTVKTPLTKLLKALSNDDKVIFIATSSNPFSCQTKPMVSMFNEMFLVPRTDYGTIQLFLYHKLQSITSMPRDYCVQALAQILQGFGFGVLIQLYDDVMTPERIVRLNLTPLSPAEFLEPLIEMGLEPVTMEDYKEYMDFYIQNSPLKTERMEYEQINAVRKVVYEKIAKKENK